MEMEATFDNLFDVSTQNALDEIEDPNVKTFLMLQRNPGRPGTITNLDIGRRKAVVTELKIVRSITNYLPSMALHSGTIDLAGNMDGVNIWSILNIFKFFALILIS